MHAGAGPAQLPARSARRFRPGEHAPPGGRCSSIVTGTMTCEVEVARGPSAFGAPEWRELLASDQQRHLFATPAWNRAWWDEFGGDEDLFVLTVRRSREPIGIVPLCRRIEGGRSVLRFVGGIDLTDYLGPVCSMEDRDVVADALTAWLASGEVEWDEFDAHNMPVPFGFAEFLVDRADRNGLSFSLEQEETSAVLVLPDSVDEYLATLDGKQRHEIRRKERRLWREHPDALVRTATGETLAADLKLFVDMHRGAHGHKGHFMSPEIATFFERLAYAFVDDGLRLDFLEAGGNPIASTFGFEYDNRYYLYNSAYEPEARRLSPGLVLAFGLVKEMIARRIAAFDFLRGPERYKYQFGAQPVPLNNVRVFRHGGPGW